MDSIKIISELYITSRPPGPALAPANPCQKYKATTLSHKATATPTAPHLLQFHAHQERANSNALTKTPRKQELTSTKPRDSLRDTKSHHQPYRLPKHVRPQTVRPPPRSLPSRPLPPTQLTSTALSQPPSSPSSPYTSPPSSPSTPSLPHVPRPTAPPPLLPYIGPPTRPRNIRLGCMGGEGGGLGEMGVEEGVVGGWER